jgi:hypothetical protein
LNVTVVAGAKPGDIVVYAGDVAAPPVGTVPFVAGAVRANNAVVSLATNGAGTVAVTSRAAAAVNLIIDVNGYFE